MGTHVIYYCDEPDGRELVDVAYQCSSICMTDTLTADGVVANDTGTTNLPRGSVQYGACPGGAETDYNVYCSSCETLLWKGLNPE